MQRRTISERVASIDEKTHIDVENGIVRNVKITANRSKNRRNYPDPVLNEATPLYEGAKSFDDHDDFPPVDGIPLPRKRSSILGRLRNVRFEAGGHRADFHVLPSKRAILEDIKADPSIFGFSHSIIADVGEERNEEGEEVIHKIHEVASVDLVSDPATTRGMFEARQRTEEGDRTMDPNTHDKAIALLEGQVKDRDATILKLTQERDAKIAEAEAVKKTLSDLQAAHDKLAKAHENVQQQMADHAEAMKAVKMEGAIAAANLSEATAESLKSNLKKLPLEEALKVIESVKEATAAARPAQGQGTKQPKSEARAQTAGGTPAASGKAGEGDIADDVMLDALLG